VTGRTLKCRRALAGDEDGEVTKTRSVSILKTQLMVDVSHLRRTCRTRRSAASAVRGERERTTGGSERGVTIVEMLIATFILGVGVVGAASLFVASAESVSVSRGQADATDIATGEVEVIRSWPYETVGIDVASDGYVPTVDGRQTITEPSGNRVEPNEIVERDGVDYVIERSVTWAVVGADPQAYKVVTVTVTWQAPGGERSVTVQTGRYEGADDA
jgi:hypothetical protein